MMGLSYFRNKEHDLNKKLTLYLRDRGAFVEHTIDTQMAVEDKEERYGCYGNQYQ